MSMSATAPVSAAVSSAKSVAPRLRAAVHRHAHVSLRQRRGVVGAVAHHGHQLARPLFAAYVFELVFGSGFGDEVVHAGFFGDVLRRQRIVARHHHGLHAHLAQTFEAFADTRLDDVLQFDHAPYLLVLADDERRAAVLRDAAHRLFDTRRAFVAGLGGDAEDRFRCALADAASVGHIDARTFGLGGELHHLHADQLQGIDLHAHFGAQLDDGFAFGRLVRDRRKHAQAGELFDTVPLCRVECRRFAVADGDRARLVQQQRVDVAGGLDGFARLGDDVGPQGAVHARDADG